MINRSKWILLALFLCPMFLSAQGVEHTNFAWALGPGNAVFVLPGATVTVCAGTALPSPGVICSPIAPAIYADATLTTLASNPITADAAGNFSFWSAGGSSYVISVFLAGYVPYSYSWTSSSTLTGGITAGGNNVFSGMNTFNGSTLFNGVATFTAGIVANQITDLGLTPGNCLQGGAGGLIVSTGNPCGSGGGGGNVSTTGTPVATQMPVFTGASSIGPSNETDTGTAFSTTVPFTTPAINSYLYLGSTPYPATCAGLQLALTAAGTIGTVRGTTIWWPSIDISCSAQIVIPPGVQIKIRGVGPTSRLINNLGTDALIMAQGSLGVSTTTTSAYTPGALSIAVASASSLSANQWVEIGSVPTDPAYYACPNTAPAGAGGQCNSELVLIDNIAGNTLNLKTSISNSYASGATVQVVTPAVLQIEDMTIVNTGQNFPAIKCWYCINSGFENLEIVGGLFTNATHPAIQIGFYHSTLDWVTGGLYGNMDGNLAGGTQSAPFVVAGASSHIQFNHPSVYKYVENAIVESSHDITINGGDYHGCADDCWNTHGDGNYNVTFSGGNYGGIPTNSAYNGVCLYVAGGPPFRSGFPDRNVTITGINCHDFGNVGIMVEGTTTPGQEVENVTVTGNTVKNGLKASGVGIVTYGCLGCVTSNNIVQDVTTNGFAYEFGYNNSFIATGNEGQQFNGATGTYGIYSTAVNYAAISSNVMRGFTAYDFYTTNSTQASRFFGNIALDGTYYWDSSLTGSVQRWGNLGDTFSANLYGDSPHHATFSGVVPFTNFGANTYFTNTFLKSIKVLSISVINDGNAPSCSTYPTFVVTDGTITTPTLTLNANYVLLNLSGTAYPSNDAISVRQTNTATCTTYPANANFQIEYAEVGN